LAANHFFTQAGKTRANARWFLEAADLNGRGRGKIAFANWVQLCGGELGVSRIQDQGKQSMSNQKLAVGFGDYDRTRMMADGTVNTSTVWMRAITRIAS
jgi:hypothetical protein